ncbi:MAG: S24 family peptidase [Cyanobacteria bacterium J06597_1]
MRRSQTSEELKALGLKTFANRLKQAIGDEAVYAFGRRAGLSDTSLRSYLKGAAVPGIDKAVAMAETAGVALQWLITGDGDMRDGDAADDDFVGIPLVDAEVSAGPGLLAREEDVREVVAFDRQWLRSKLGTNPSQLTLVTVSGDSMAPTLMDGDTIFVDRQVNELRDGIYVFQMNGDLLVKRLQKLPGSLISVISDNPKFQTFTVDMNDCDNQIAIVGRYRGRISLQ